MMRAGKSFCGSRLQASEHKVRPKKKKVFYGPLTRQQTWPSWYPAIPLVQVDGTALHISHFDSGRIMRAHMVRGGGGERG